MSVAVEFQNVDILFGTDKQKADALPLVDAGRNREEILAETGAVLGCAGCDLTADPHQASG
mgnify:FL=1